MPRPLRELLDVDEPAWPTVQEWVRSATNAVEVLPPAPDSGTALEAAQVSVRSPIGALVYHTGGLLIDHGWLRVLGSGHPRLPRPLMAWNRGRTFRETGEQPGLLLVADDVLGGFFGINGGAFNPAPAGEVFYFAPDTLRWETLGRGYTDFLLFCLSGDLDGFYKPFRWPGWQRDVEPLAGDQGIGVYPFLFTAEGKDITKCSRRPVPLTQLYGLYVEDLPRQLGS